MYQEAEFATNIQTGKDLWRFQWKSTQTSKQELPKDLQLFGMKFVHYLHLIFDIPITKLTELWL